MKRVLFLMLCLLLLPSGLAEPYLVYREAPEDYLSDCYLIGSDGDVLAWPEEYATIYELRSPDSGEGALYAVSQYGTAQAESEGQEAPMALMDGEGRLLTEFEFSYLYMDDCHDELHFGRADGTTGLLFPSGKVRVQGPFAYDSVIPMGEDTYLALDPDGCVLSVDAEGQAERTEIHAAYMYAPDTPGDPVAAFYLNDADRCGYLDAQGRLLNGADYAYCSGFAGGLAIVQPEESGAYGVIDTQGTLVVPAEYAWIESVGEEPDRILVAKVLNDPALVLIDAKTFEARARLTFDDPAGVVNMTVDTFRSDMFGVCLYDEEYNILGRRVYDLRGNARLTGLPGDGHVLAYYARQDALPQRLVVELNENTGESCLVDLEGNVRGETWQGISASLWQRGQGRYVVTRFDERVDPDGETMPVYGSMRFGVIDEEGRVLLEPVFDSLRVLDLDRYWVRQGSRTGLIDGEGNWYFAVDDYADLLD